MNCQETQELLHGYMDGELDLRSNLDVEQHVQACPACARALQAQQALRSALGDSALYYKAPPHLRARVQTTLRVRDRSAAGSRIIAWRWLAVGLSFALRRATGKGSYCTSHARLSCSPYDAGAARAES